MEMTYNSPATSHLLVLESHQPIIHYIGGSKMVKVNLIIENDVLVKSYI